MDEIFFCKHRMTWKGVLKKNKKQVLNLKKYCHNIYNFFDIGANVGAVSLYAAKWLDVRNIYSFEPVKENYSFLKENVDKNKDYILHNYNSVIHPYNIGFWSDNVVKKIGFPHNREDFDNTGLYTVWSDKNAVEAMFIKLDDWCNENNIYPDFIKIDAEGSEKEIVLGGLESITKARFILYEYNANYKEHMEGLKEILLSMGYKSIDNVARGQNIFMEKKE